MQVEVEHANCSVELKECCVIGTTPTDTALKQAKREIK